MEALQNSINSEQLFNFNPNCVSEVQLFYKTEVKPIDRPVVSCSQHAYLVFKHYWDPNSIELREEFKLLLLNRGQRALGIINISTGGVAGTIADPKLIFSSALVANASGIIVAHNHPSGNLKPSEADLQLTKKLKAAGKLLDISVLDHIIITCDGYYSMSDNQII